MQKRIFIVLGIIFVAAFVASLLVQFPQFRDDAERTAMVRSQQITGMLGVMRNVYRRRITAAGLLSDEAVMQLCPAAAITEMATRYGEQGDTELSFANVSDRPRNPINRADEFGLAAMAHFRSHPDAPDHLLRFTGPDGEVFLQYAVPLWIEPPCLKCHGAREEAPEAVRRLYDGGFGYHPGELRGILQVRQPTAEIERELVARGNHQLLYSLGLFLAIFAAISWLLRAGVFRPLAALKRGAEAVAGGDYRVRLDERGPAELQTLARAFNGMAESVAEREHQLLERDRQLVQAQRIGRVGSWHWLPQFDRVTLSREAARILGLGDRDQCDGQTFRARVHPDDRPQVVEAILALGPDLRYREVEYRILEGDEERWIKERAELALDEQGCIHEVRGTVADLTRTYRNRRRLQLADTVFRTTTEAILVMDGFGRIIDANPTYTRLTGYSREESLGRPPPISGGDQKDGGLFTRLLTALLEMGHWHGEVWARRKNGERYPQLLNLNTVTDDHGEVAYLVASFADISELKDHEENLEQLAYYDSLTGLANRLQFKLRLRQELKVAERHGRRLGLLMIDLDHFKEVNDSLGHDQGDRLLVEVASRFSGCVREVDTVARLGGDEFVAILTEVTEAANVAHIAQRMIEVASAPVTLQGRRVTIGASIGIALHPEDGRDPDTLIRHADLAMYRAKQGGRNRFHHFEATMNDEEEQRLEREAALRQTPPEGDR